MSVGETGERRSDDGDVKVIINDITAENAVGDEMELVVNSFGTPGKNSQKEKIELILNLYIFHLKDFSTIRYKTCKNIY